MGTIRYESRAYRPRSRDPDAAGPIAAPVTVRDFAFQLAQDDQGRFIYDRLVAIRVTTARPVELKSLDDQAKPIHRWTIEVKTRDKSVASSQLVMAWFPYSFEWEDSTSFKGHRNRSKAEIAPLLDAVARGEIPWDEFLRNSKYRDIHETDSGVLTAYFPDPRRADESSWRRRRSQLLKPLRSHGQAATELLAFGICSDLNSTVEAVLRDESTLKLLSQVDDWIFYRLWKDHPFCPPRRFRPALLANDTLEKILRSAIRKAIAGPVRNQESFLGWPVASWARAVFLGTLYNLNRRAELPDVSDEPESRGEQASYPLEAPPEFDFLGAVADLVQDLDAESLDAETLLDGAVVQLTSPAAQQRFNALVLITAVVLAKAWRDFVRVAPQVVGQIDALVRDDPDQGVREAARIARSLLEKHGAAQN